MTRRLLIAACVTLALVGVSPVAGDILPDGHEELFVGVRMDWGSLSGRLSRPVVPRSDDTWETLAVREAGDARWAPTIRAMTGRDTPGAGSALPAWLPPKDLAFDPQATWWSAYVDSSKFGRDSDISRTGFDRVDPGEAAIPVFGTVTFAVRRHVGPLSKEGEAASTRFRAKDVIAKPKAAGFAVAPSFEVPMSVKRGSRLRRVEQSWRVESVTEEGLRLLLLEEKRFDSAGRLLAGGVTSSGPWIAALLGVALVVLVAVFARRPTPSPA